MANRILIGRHPSSPSDDYVVKISKPDFNVLTATPDQLMFNSAGAPNTVIQAIDVGYVGIPKLTSVTINVPDRGGRPQVYYVAIRRDRVNPGETPEIWTRYMVEPTYHIKATYLSNTELSFYNGDTDQSVLIKYFIVSTYE